jgi:hypothetical protein
MITNAEATQTAVNSAPKSQCQNFTWESSSPSQRQTKNWQFTVAALAEDQPD